ncbi:putative PurR-regulated permease PerM [Dyadobacter sp. BE34]|uniref:PurR-regulated permease PerM n=1 Tax=Dyadobacter fermentans TaxID=94254 RepID=A0ABU1R838_9BACT|nr:MULTISPECIES: AI-2E family transporter [Dyadobacter]MDR6809533.1 putative PurR-regulated permease PerM [Dyadobacter fermentans]MDR7047210.1 putative PurR-regulated permease PerM [Dyadobacter sp. BE242]MDR7201446.1 putative PurR-regulated permease PerM [Dyadobacter sp. BE34]MDR7219316.1 putative PurR-regulated permease PerM [Dyadobacter sp. BE31]MDR7267082.1 putative PurR-regulated permease PerM [Dyadobacter sp. BE32]
MNSTAPQPFYQKLSLTLLAIGIIMLAIYLGQDIVVPLALAGLLAVLLRPLEGLFIRIGIPKLLSITLALLIAVLIVSAVTVLISMQLADFSDEWPKLKRNIDLFYRDARRWIRREYSVSYRQQAEYLKNAQSKTLETFQGPETLGVVTGPLGTLILIPIYTFLLLYYRAMLIHFTVVLFAEEQKQRVLEILGQIKSIIQSYMVGLLLETTAVAVLNSAGLLILNVQYAILLGVMAAILNLVPYIGGLVATALAVMVTFISHPEIDVLLGVVGVFIAVQVIDNNFLVPFIVGSKVRINALVSIVGVLVGGALAGLSGMFLSIPVIAMMKVIFDRVPGLEPWGILLGDQTPEQANNNLFRFVNLKKVAPGDPAAGDPAAGDPAPGEPEEKNQP